MEETRCCNALDVVPNDLGARWVSKRGSLPEAVSANDQAVSLETLDSSSDGEECCSEEACLLKKGGCARTSRADGRAVEPSHPGLCANRAFGLAHSHGLLALLTVFGVLLAALGLAALLHWQVLAITPQRIPPSTTVRSQQASTTLVLMAIRAASTTIRSASTTIRPASTTITSTEASGACANGADHDIWYGGGNTRVHEFMHACGAACWGGTLCVRNCVQQKEGYSDTCSKCFGDVAACTALHCIIPCLGGAATKNCLACVSSECMSTFHACSGLQTLD